MLINHFKIKLLLTAIAFQFIPTACITMGKHALLIGIQDYKGTPFNSLKGPVNDIQLTKSVLRERFGFSEENLIILLDAQATHTGIENAFMTLIEKVNPGDFVYIHYSGHGSQTADLNGDEIHGEDQTWVSYATRSNQSLRKDNYDVLDDEINAWLAMLYAKTDKVVFVSDSCHSATVSRGFELVRAVDKDERPHILGKLTYTQPNTYRGIRVGSARDDESAIGKRREDGQYYGAFTWHWVRNLQQAQTGDTWNHIYKRTYAQLTAERGVAQKPQMEGERRQQVLGGGFIPQPQTVSVVKITPNWIKIPAGSLSGITKGSIYRLYKPQHANSQNLPSLTITKVETFASYGKPKGIFKTGDLVVEESHAYHFAPIQVSLEAEFPNGIDKPLLQALQTAFETKQFPAYHKTNNLSRAEYRLRFLHPKRKNGQFIRTSVNDPLPKSFSSQPAELWLLTPEGKLFSNNLQMQFDNPMRGIELLRDNLNKLARIRELKKLEPSHRSRRKLPVTVQTYLLSPVDSCPKRANCIKSINSVWYRKTGAYSLSEIEKRTLNQDDVLSFTLHNRSRKRDYYCYIININPNCEIEAIFPAPTERLEYARVKAGEKWDLVEETVFTAELVGKETLKFIISRSPIDVNLLEQEAFEQRGSFNPLEQLLFVHAIYGKRGRTKAFQNNEWATGLVTFEVR